SATLDAPPSVPRSVIVYVSAAVAERAERRATLNRVSTSTAKTAARRNPWFDILPPARTLGQHAPSRSLRQPPGRSLRAAGEGVDVLHGEVREGVHDRAGKVRKRIDNHPLAGIVGERIDLLHFRVGERRDDLNLVVRERV